MSLPLINKQFMKQGLAITIATMKMNVTHATTEPQKYNSLVQISMHSSLMKRKGHR